MDAEVQAILQNIKSLADQATQMSGGSAEKAAIPEEPETPGQAPAELPPEIAEKVLKYLKEMDGAPGEPEDELNKSADEDEDDVNKSAEGPTASDNAEARIDETGEENEKNINEVAKALAKMMMKGKNAKKTVAKSAGISELTKVVKFLADELKVQKEFNVNILKGLGIADSILASEQKAKPKAQPMEADPAEVKKSLEYIQSILGIKPQAETAQSGTNGQGHFVAKSLSSNDGALLKGLFPKSHK